MVCLWYWTLEVFLSVLWICMFSFFCFQVSISFLSFCWLGNYIYSFCDSLTELEAVFSDYMVWWLYDPVVVYGCIYYIFFVWINRGHRLNQSLVFCNSLYTNKPRKKSSLFSRLLTFFKLHLLRLRNFSRATVFAWFNKVDPYIAYIDFYSMQKY